MVCLVHTSTCTRNTQASMHTHTWTLRPRCVHKGCVSHSLTHTHKRTRASERQRRCTLSSGDCRDHTGLREVHADPPPPHTQGLDRYVMQWGGHGSTRARARSRSQHTHMHTQGSDGYEKQWDDYGSVWAGEIHKQKVRGADVVDYLQVTHTHTHTHTHTCARTHTLSLSEGVPVF